MAALACAILAAHGLLLLAMLLVGRLPRVSYGAALWVVAAIVPVAGPVSAITLVCAERSKRAGRRALDFEGSRAPDEEYPPGLEPDVMSDVVPLEDAMLVDDASTRRDLMLDMLIQGGDDLGASLAMARSSGDAEVAHYASSATMELSASYEEALAAGGLRYQQDPDDLDALRRYLDLLERYLASGMAEGVARRIQEARYREALARKIRIDPEEADYARLAQSQLDEGLIEDAGQTISQMEERYPDDDDTWLLRLKYWYDLRRPQEIRAMVRARQESGRVSERVRPEVEFWERVAGEA